MHPDGIRVAFTATRMNLDEDRYDRGVWLWDGAVAKQFSHGPIDFNPRWSPDGTHLAFLSANPAEPTKYTVRALDSDGGESRLLAEFPLAATEVEWSPDGTKLAVVAGVWNDDWDGLTEEERDRKPRRITRPQWRFDNKGWRHDRSTCVFVIDTSGGVEPVQLTDNGYHAASIAWHPDGSKIGFVSARHEGRGFDPGSQVWEVAEGSAPVPLSDVGRYDYIGYDPAGRPVVIGGSDPWDWPSVEALFRVEEDGSFTDLTGHLDRSPMPLSPSVKPLGPQWIGDAFFTVIEDDGRVRLSEIDADGTETTIVGGDRAVTGASFRADGSAAAFVAASPTDPGELYWLEGGEQRRLTSLNDEFRASVQLAQPEAFSFTSDGVDISGWVYLPPGDGPVPLLLNIHGGPASQYGFGFFDEFQVYTGAGYGVVACNPRGSSGRGRDFVRAVIGEWVKKDALDIGDILSCVDAALERFPRLDGDRRGVMGGSYGGLAAIRVLAADQRYASGVVERALTTFGSFAGTSDIGHFFSRMYLGEETPKAWEKHWDASPLSFAELIETPTLVLHSEDDFRCPIEQGEQLFSLLQHRGVPSEMVRFPGESHELSRSGGPKHRKERFEAILDWHGRHLS